MNKILGIFLVTLSLFCLIIFLDESTEAAPPIGGAPITSPFGRRDAGGRASKFHKGVDIGTNSGTPILAPSAGSVTHGAGGGFIYWVEITTSNGDVFLFGDCSSSTLQCATGRVNEGTVIGYTGGDYYNGPLGYSTGPHVHIEYTPAGGGRVDPVPKLKSLGCILDGSYVSEGGESATSGGMDNIALPWGVDNMYKLGESINEMLKTFSEWIKPAISRVKDIAYGLFVVLCIIDFTIPLLLKGLSSIELTFVFEKLFKYGMVGVIISYWPKLINEFFLSFSNSIATAYLQDNAIADIATNPQNIMQKGIAFVLPGLNKVAEMGALDLFFNFPTVTVIMVCVLGVVLAYFMVAIYMLITYVEFYISAVLTIITVPFSTWHLSKFIAEGSIGHLVSATLKLTIVAIMVGITTLVIQDLPNTKDIFEQTTPGTTITGNAHVTGSAAYVNLAKEKAKKYGIPENLFVAQIQHESGWNPKAVSSAGAQGLGQLMPGTAKGLGVSNSFDPEQNLEGAAKLMKQLYGMYGDWNYALAAYNGGTGNVTKGEDLSKKKWAMQYINDVHKELNGSYEAKSSFNATVIVPFIIVSLSLIALAYLTYKIPKSIMTVLGGKYDLP